MKTIFTQKSVVLECVPIEKGSLVVYAGTQRNLQKKTLKNAQSCWKKKMVLLEFQLPSLS